MGICSFLTGRGAIQNSNKCFAYSWPHVNVHEIGWNWSEDSGLVPWLHAAVLHRDLRNPVWRRFKSLSAASHIHSHDPSGEVVHLRQPIIKLLLLFSRNPAPHVKRLRDSCNLHNSTTKWPCSKNLFCLATISNNQVCWKNTRKKVQLVWAKDNVIFTDVNEKMDNTARCLQVSTQLTLLCFFKRNQMQ